MADTTAAELADTIDDAMLAKTRPPLGAMALLGIAAGAQIGFGSIGYLVAQAGGTPGGAVQLLSGVAFSVGLMLVMVTGTQLFTGNTMFVLPAAQDRLSIGETLRDWSVVWIANLVGSIAVAALFVAAGGPQAIDGAVGAAALKTATTKLGKDWVELIASGMLANMLVCLGVWMATGAKSIGGKIAAVIGPVALFVAAGFEHSVANMSLLPIAWGIDPQAVPIGAAAFNVALATLGNILGGSVVAIVLAAGHRKLRQGTPT
ncbi:formate/nitrite transporter family protein [Sphingomonas sp. Leaf407]|uniref:formate/nitrite transporter family protein n=1 Tax=unclassified Sphingomonas TaxID=196159 RepID=UPI0006FC434C|nr:MULTISPECIES: formate/nitrite transporter family protein [unclassified Sphingomonas]KQN37286.1 formate/nitrite transporter family protein [Sphingomonas sp. Leaf42]KQT27654.1 formate/nitrite transporter family protein [Sphingomonas sp. Leaf407]